MIDSNKKYTCKVTVYKKYGNENYIYFWCESYKESEGGFVFNFGQHSQWINKRLVKSINFNIR